VCRAQVYCQVLSRVAGIKVTVGVRTVQSTAAI